MSNNQRLNFIDLFSGAGGLSCGMELAGMRCILGVDHQKHAIATFAKNHKHAETFSGDIKLLKGKLLKEKLKDQTVDLVVGGPPCQGFSTVGTGDPDDTRNELFLEFCRIVKITKPQYVVLENVTGMLAKKNEKILNAIISKFNKLGFTMDVKVLAANEYNVPENRKRTIMIGSRNHNKITFPKTTSKNKPKTVGEALKGLQKCKKTICNHDLQQARPSSRLDTKRIHHIPEGKGIRYKEDNKKYLPPSLRLDIDWENLQERRFRQTKFKRLDRSLPSPTIMTNRHTYFHPTEDRYLTQREAAAIQSFPNSFEFLGPVSSQWRQIGNAVPPILAKAIGKAILKMHKEYLNDSKTINKKADKKELKKNIANIRKSAFIY